MSKSGLFLGGVPTEPDVKRLIEAYSTLKPGDEITHAEMARTIDADERSNRYRTVVTAWRRQMLKLHNVDMQPIRGVGFRIIDGIERISASVKDYGGGVRKIVRSVGRARRVEMEKLTNEQQRVSEHALRHMEATADSARRASKEIASKFTPQAQLPRARPAR